MKIRIADRLLVALSGLILILAALCLVDQRVVGFGLTAALQTLTSTQAADHTRYIIVTVIEIAVLALLGLYCVGVLFRHQKRHRRGFVVQQTDCGELSIAVRAIEGLVQKCVDRHEEITVVSTGLDTSRDGLIIRLRIGLTGGVNIPLAVSALQKQIKQYVTSCSGVDVKEVKVQVETSVAKDKASPFKTEELSDKAAPLPTVEDKTPEITAASLEAQESEEKKRPLHQRLFGRAEEPVTVPVPPAPAAPETAAEEPAAPETEVPAEPAPADEPAAEPSAEATEETETAAKTPACTPAEESAAQEEPAVKQEEGQDESAE